MNAHDAHAAYFDLMDDATAEAAVPTTVPQVLFALGMLAVGVFAGRVSRTAEEMARTDDKRRRAAEYAPRPVHTGRAARNAAAAVKSGAHAIEGRILARQGY